MQLLSEFIGLVLEAQFNINAMKKLRTVPDVYNYVKGVLKPMGRGSSRMTYMMSSRKILKLAKNDAGLGQNEAEVDVFTNPSTKPIVAKIYDYDPQYKWVVSELVRPLGNGEFRRLTGWDFDEFAQAVRSAKRDMEPRVPQKMQQFFDSVMSAVKANKLEPSDLSVEEHWGKTGDGRIVLLDYGYTTEIYNKHYAGDYPSNYAGISRTNHKKGDDTGDIDWGDTFM